MRRRAAVELASLTLVAAAAVGLNGNILGKMPVPDKFPWPTILG